MLIRKEDVFNSINKDDELHQLFKVRSSAISFFARLRKHRLRWEMLSDKLKKKLKLRMTIFSSLFHQSKMVLFAALTKQTWLKSNLNFILSSTLRLNQF